jgi:hypothetical protein
MARFIEPTDTQIAGYRAWVASRPEAVRLVAAQFEPWSLYRMKSTGHRVTIASFGEGDDGCVTLTVHVRADFNWVAFERQVFGIDPADLEPCELPDPSEPTGALFSPAEVDDNLDDLRLAFRPDLWTRDPHTGKAVLKQ